MTALTSIEICAGAGGQALGLERAGFHHLALVEIDPWPCATLRLNRPSWNVIGPTSRSIASLDANRADVPLFDAGAYSMGYPGAGDVRLFDARPFAGMVDLLAGGVPCPPFSKAGKQLGENDERDMFPEAVRIARECTPKAVMLENVRGLLDPKFARYRRTILARLRELGYIGDWKLLQASDYGVPQLRPRSILVALQKELLDSFRWPMAHAEPAPSVGEALRDQIAAGGWEGADEWARHADRVAPTLVGGSKRHGGPDLGPTRARREWARLGVDGRGLADAPPPPGFVGMPRLTVRMTATLQGFPANWGFAGRKTHSYRQVGNALPPPVAAAVGRAIHQAILGASGSRLGDEC